jgi:prepilin-type N-terminal cleavage/methylation domain-containing protein
MVAAVRGRGFTIVEVIVVILIIGLMISLLLPGLGGVREAARRAQCLNNLKHLGLGFRNHQPALNRLPPSCSIYPTQNSYDGWSWAIWLLPYMTADPLYESIDLQGKPLDGTEASVHALKSSYLEYHCPSFTGQPRTRAGDDISNYKALGATHIESLSVASPRPTVPKYNPAGAHPDGGIFPGSKHGMKEITDGAAYTFLLAETIEPTFARWTVGREMTMVGLPRTIEFAKVRDYWAPVGFTPDKFWADTTVSPNDVYLRWDYDKNPYDGGDGSQGGKFGPSSYHIHVTNHLFADGSVQSVGNAIDAAAYMFLITRCAGDPSGPTEP